MDKEESKSEIQEKFEKLLGRKFNKYDLEETWTIGGITGGNCWGDVADCHVTSQSEPDLAILDEILEKTCPKISLMLYRKLEKAEGLIKYTEYTENGYYGNYYEKKKKILNLDVLYKFLVENKLWNETE